MHIANPDRSVVTNLWGRLSIDRGHEEVGSHEVERPFHWLRFDSPIALEAFIHLLLVSASRPHVGFVSNKYKL